ncbi:hypothetical protein G7Y79_00051g086430 [Physcia stellaris]|nr:hypothetical protein G7Y79_00051g086430 [Physcia stellaris]
MGAFAEILRGMTALSPEALQEIRAAEAEFTTDAQDADDDWPDYGADGAHDPDAEQPRASMDTTSTVAHTPLPPHSAGSSRRGLRTPSIPSIRAPRSLRSRASSVFTSRSSARSIIRLAPEGGGLLDLPYVIDVDAGASGAAG